MKVAIILSLVAVVFLSAASAVRKPPRSCLPARNCGQYGIRCPGRYTCIKKRCCLRSPVIPGPIRVCPRMTSGIKCPRIRVRPACIKDRDCGKGKLCCPGRCGRRYCTKGVPRFNRG